MIDLVIITGASRGIGRSVADTCASLCKHMLVISSSDKIFENLSTDNKCMVHPLRFDLANYTEIQQIIENLLHDKLSSLNIKSLGIVLCGASVGEYGGIFSSKLEDWDNLYRCNVLGNIAVIKACQEYIQSGTKTRIVFFGGGGAAYGYPDFSGYALSKVATIRAVENIGMEFEKNKYNASIVALAPGAVDTDMLAKVVAHGGAIKTKTDISEPTNFVRRFLTDEIDASKFNSRFLHVRDEIQSMNNLSSDHFKLRRVQ